MAEPKLTAIFGANVTQDATTITILKSDLNMTAEPINRGEQVLAAIIKNAATTLTAEEFATNVDQSITIARGYDALAYRTIGTNQQTLYQSQFTINFAKVQATSGITPDDY